MLKELGLYNQTCEHSNPRFEHETSLNFLFQLVKIRTWNLMESSLCFIFYFWWLMIRGQPNQEERQQVILLWERHLSFVGSREEPKCHQCKFADWIRLDPNLISRHRVEKSLRTDNKGFIVLKNPNHNNRQSLIRMCNIAWERNSPQHKWIKGESF